MNYISPGTSQNPYRARGNHSKKQGSLHDHKQNSTPWCCWTRDGASWVVESFWPSASHSTEHLRHVAEQCEHLLPGLLPLFTQLNCQLLLRTCNISFCQRLWKCWALLMANSSNWMWRVSPLNAQMLGQANSVSAHWSLYSFFPILMKVWTQTVSLSVQFVQVDALIPIFLIIYIPNLFK